MKSKTTVIQRFMAMALAIVMVLGFLPAGAIQVKADAGKQLPLDGWEGFIELYRQKTYIKRSDNGELYIDRYGYTTDGHPLRMYHFRGSDGRNDRYNLTQAMYCIQYGVKLPDTGLYIAKNPKILENMGWPQAVQEGIMLSLGFGFPNLTVKEINEKLVPPSGKAFTADDAYAATQILVWECQQGLRNFRGKTPELKMYRNYIEDTPAEPIYWYILELIESYINNENYAFSNLTKNARFMVWSSKQDSTRQMMMGFHFTENPGTLKYDEGKIEVHKRDPNRKPLAGAMFKAVHEETQKTFYLGPTDQNGYASKDKLPLGTYTVTETVFPEGYEPSEEEKKNYQWVVTVDGNENNIITIDVENYQHGIITINKTVTGGTATDKAGWKFDIYDSNWKYVETVTTDQSGTAVTSRLLAGKYYVVEAGNTDPEKWNGKYWELDIGAKTGGSLNLLRNASLTSEALGYNYGWYGGDNTKLAYVTFDGMKCLYMADPTTNTSEQNIASFRQPRIRLSAGTYTFSGKVYVEEERTFI